MKKELLRIENLSAGALESNAICGVWLHLFAGQSTGLYGLYESSPSTLMQVICGNERPTQGRLILDNQRIVQHNPQQMRRYGVYRIGRQMVLVNALSIAENIFIMRRGGLRLFWLHRRMMHSQARQLLEDIGVELPLTLPVHCLTTAQRHLIELAKAVGMGCKILLFDYAFTSYTQADLLRLSQILERLKSRGYAVLINSNSVEELGLFCDEVVFFRNKTIGKKLPLAQLRWQDILSYIGADAASIVPKAISSHQPGEQEAFYFLDILPKGQQLSISLTTGHVTVLLCVEQFLRESIFKVLAGQMKAPTAQFSSGGQRLHHYTNRQRAAHRIVAIASPQESGQCFEKLSIAENLLLPSMKKSSGPFGFVPHGLYNAVQRDGTLPPGDSLEGLEGRQLIALNFERWLIYRPRVVILQEPMAAGDAVTEGLIQGYIDALARQGAAVLLIAARLQGLEKLADHIIRLSDEHSEVLYE